MNIKFYLRFHTKFGQSLWVSGNIDELGNDDPVNAIAMNYLNEEFWHYNLEIRKKDLQKKIRYKYFLKTEDGELLSEWENERYLYDLRKDINEIQLVDTWNHAGEYENAFFSAPFRKVLLKTKSFKNKEDDDKTFTHIFKVKAPLLNKNEVLCMAGNTELLGNWSTEKPALMDKPGDWWMLKLDLADCDFPIAYKYGIYNNKEKKFKSFENGNNRLLYSDSSKKKISIVHDGFVHFPNNTWRGSGVAIPVFSLRSKNSFGVGEFSDIRLLVDWANETSLKLIHRGI